MHPNHGREKLGITDKMLGEVTDNESPLEFWQLRAPTACLIRRPALRIHSGKASALGVERLWSGAGLIFVDNRRSLATLKLMQLLNVKCNAFLLDSMSTDKRYQEVVQQLVTNFSSIYEDVALAEEEEEAVALRHIDQQEAKAPGSGDMDSDVDELRLSEPDDDPLDLFALE